MYPPEFDYVRAGSVAEAVSLLNGHKGAKLLAGGHSLIPILKLRQVRPSVLVDIGRIAELKGIRTSDGTLRIGALTTHAMIAESSEAPQVLSEAAGVVADVQVRNRGTIGGNVAHADPGSDLPTVLTALNARFDVTGPSGQRRIPASEFFTGMFETALAEGEILTEVVVPLPPEGSGSAYVKMINPASGYAMLGVAAVLSLEDGRCKQASVALGGLTPIAVRARSVESALAGRELDDQNLSAAADEVLNDLGDDILGDIHASADYRRGVAPVYVRRALKAAAARAS